MDSKRVSEFVTWAALVLLGAISLIFLALPSCKSLENLVFDPGCREFAKAQMAEYQADGWQALTVGPAGDAADFIVYARPVAGSVSGLEVEIWISRLDGSDPSDAKLEAEGFTRERTCNWDGEAPPPQFQPTGTFWRKAVSADSQADERGSL
jgi:hypothetical protein